jgi:hypothetical protein
MINECAVAGLRGGFLWAIKPQPAPCPDKALADPTCHADCDSVASAHPGSSKQRVGADASSVGMTGRSSTH